MELPVSLQLLQLGLSAALGVGLAVHYDILRVLRRRLPRLTHLLDLWFWLTALPACLLFALYVGRGMFRLFFFVGIFCGSGLWFGTLSRPFRVLLRQIFHILAVPICLVRKICKKIREFAKKYFSRRKKWYMIKKQKHKIAVSAHPNAKEDRSMQQKKKKLTAMLVVLAVVIALSASIIAFKSLAADEADETEALRQELSAVTEANEALRPISDDAQTYKQQYDTLTRIAGEYADPAVVSSGLTSSAMESAAREEGYVFPDETVFKSND